MRDAEALANTRAVALASVAMGAAITGGLLWLIYVRAPSAAHGEQLAWLPGFNATCNALSATLLVAGYRAIRRRQVAVHMRFMLAALACSALFLAGYIAHHTLHGDTKFAGEGAVRTVYFAVLISHIVLSAVALPLILSTLAFALSGRFTVHRRVARLTLPIWLYVSVTGVLVYGFLRFYG
jgi:putative membrane protein